MKLKELDAKYRIYELIFADNRALTIKKAILSTRSNAIRLYGDYYVYSIKDYDKTTSTSICLGKEKDTGVIYYNGKDLKQ